MTTLPDRMTVIAIRSPGGPDVLVPEQRPTPTPGAGEILVKVAAAGVNRPDVMQRMGLYPPPPGATDIPGLEIAGEVVARGAGRTRWKDGDKVMALVVGGGYAEYCLAHESHALPIPAGLSPIAGRGHTRDLLHRLAQRLRARAPCRRRDAPRARRFLGIGTTAIQLAKAFGARVIATAGTAEKCAACRELGADVAVNYKTEDFVAATKKATDGRGADVILDMVGGELYRTQLRGSRRRRTRRANRFPERLACRRRFPAPHVQAAHSYGLDAARPCRSRTRPPLLAPSRTACSR